MSISSLLRFTKISGLQAQLTQHSEAYRSCLAAGEGQLRGCRGARGACTCAEMWSESGCEGPILRAAQHSLGSS